MEEDLGLLGGGCEGDALLRHLEAGGPPAVQDAGDDDSQQRAG
eukprot:CAMPEP_0181497416 /NCGR_PEP_ID=MMETSP1110-20121109/53525_1 /TAXON_ID=174948 /ORGANISM="Symbiodinium sp., Strain CCMP421" /LENGTH=42 /DNA_ID= /DNA_START= /DNA_END= /DNA_ORIENTATION=